MGIDWDAVTLENKILIVIFIFFTVLVNACYLFKYLLAPRAMFRAGHFGKISLAVGSILMALFSYAVIAKIVYENNSAVSCRTWALAAVYEAYFFPFVFGMSFLTMSLDMSFNRAQHNAKLLSIVMAVLPWLVALPVICPVAFAGADLENCIFDDDFKDRKYPLNVLGSVLPAIVAILSGIVLYAKKGKRTQTSSPTAAFISFENVHTVNTAAPVASHSTQFASMEHQTPQQSNILGTTQCSPVFPQSQETPPQYPQQYMHLNQYPQLPLSPPPSDQQSPRQNAQAEPVHSAAYNDLSMQQEMKERRHFLWASIIFFFSLLPLAIFSLSVDSTAYRRIYNPSTATLIIAEICFWTHCLYPVLVPIIWWSQVQI